MCKDLCYFLRFSRFFLAFFAIFTIKPNIFCNFAAAIQKMNDMKKNLVLAAGLMVAMSMSLVSCNKDKKETSKDEPYNGQQVENTLLSPEQSKERLMYVANLVTGKFNTADQKAAIQLADGLYDKYQNYNMDAFADQYEHRYDALFAMQKYAKAVMTGEAAPTSMDQTYVFGFDGESAIFEANERTHAWEYKGKASDNSLILRCTDANGTQCEAKMWGEGATHRFEYTWEKTHWVTPKIYTDGSSITEVYGGGYYNGEWHTFYMDDRGNWYYYDWYNDRTVYVSMSDIEHIYGYDSYYDYYEYDMEKQQWFRYDYANEYEVSDGMRTAIVDLPEKIFFTLKQGNNEIIRVEFRQEMQKNDHAYFSINARVANLSWTADAKINSTNGSGAYAFKYGNETLLSVAVQLPSYKLIDKADSQSYEEWLEQYEDRYDELLRQIGSADAIVDIYGWIQLKANIDNFSYLYRDIKKLDDGGYYTRSREDAQKLVESINAHVKTGMYYGSDIQQASVIAQLARDTYYGGYWDEVRDTWVDQEYEEYFAEGVLYFPEDGTTYAFDQYFNRKPFTDLQYTLEDLANKYIRLSQYLYDEVGEVSFD